MCIRDSDITGMQGIYVQWTLDPSVGANIICDYLVYYATSAAGPWTLYDDGYSIQKQASLIGISAATSTFVKIEPVLCSTECPDTASEIAWTIPVQKKPGKIKFFTVTPEATQVMLDWSKPNQGGSEIIKYEIQIRKTSGTPGSFTNATGTHVLPVGGTGNFVQAFSGLPPRDTFGMYSHMITGLAEQQSYSVAIRAVNAIGAADYSAANPDPFVREQIFSTLSAGVPKYEGEEPPENFNYDTPGAKFGEDQEFNETKDFGAGQTFDNNTEFAPGQTFDEDVN